MNAKYPMQKTTPLAACARLMTLMILSNGAVWAQSSTVTNITVPGAVSVSVAGLNVNGEVAGYCTTATSAQRAFLWSAGVGIDLGTLGGGTSVGNGLNSLGQVVGYSSSVGDTAYHAFSGIGQTLFDLGTLGGSVSSATAI